MRGNPDTLPSYLPVEIKKEAPTLVFLELRMLISKTYKRITGWS